MSKDHVVANFPEFIEAVQQAGQRIAGAILPPGIAGGNDAAGGRVESLTEAVMGVTAGLVQIADALNNVAEAIRESSQE